MPEPRSFRDRFPAPWRVEETPGGFRVLDRTGTPLASIYAASENQRRRVASRGLSPGEARALAHAITRLPALVEPQ